MAKSLVNAFVMNQIILGLALEDDNDIVNLDLYATNRNHPIHDLIQKIGNLVNEVRPNQKPSSSGYDPNAKEKPLYDRLLTALKRNKVETPSYDLIHEVSGQFISELIQAVDDYISENKLLLNAR